MEIFYNVLTIITFFALGFVVGYKHAKRPKIRKKGLYISERRWRLYE